MDADPIKSGTQQLNSWSVKKKEINIRYIDIEVDVNIEK
jgi:hypothetical protein